MKMNYWNYKEENVLKPYIIGETAYNHEGDINYLYNIIDDISDLELNAVKLHLLLNPESYMSKNHPLYEKIKNWIFSEDQWHELIKYSQSKNLDVIALCDDIESILFITKNYGNIFAVEIHASGLNDYNMLNEAVNLKNNLILGIGGSTIDEIQYAVDFLKTNAKNELILMYGFQSYPTDYSEINSSKMLKIKELFDLPIGYADHTAFNDPNNEIISCMAAMMGFNILEKHYTPDYAVERIDYHAAVGKKQMQRIKELMQLSLLVYGNGSLKMTDAELNYGNTGPMKKAIVAKKKINKGEILTMDNLCFKRTDKESPIKQMMFLKLLGLTAKDNIEKDEIIDFSKVKYEFKS